MSALWVSLLLGAAVLIVAVLALRQRSRATADAAYIDELERLLQSRSDETALVTRLSGNFASVLELDVLKRAIAAELPGIVGEDNYWVVARLNGWSLLAGEPAEAGGVIPKGLTLKPETWESFPLVSAGRSVGLLGVRRTDAGFTEEQRRVLAATALLLAGAIRNVYLFGRVRDLSMVDPLTRCLMRQFGVEALSREMRRMRRTEGDLCIAIVDIDHFKSLNDTHGHPAGDRALAMVGRVLKEGLRSTDIACRYGGDEFLIVLPETAIAGAVHAVENLRRRIATTAVDVSGEPLTVSASVGVTAVDATEEDPAVPITRADAAMYDAKRSGRNHVAVKSLPSQAPPAAAPGLPERLDGVPPKIRV
jgi:diguanylate cyclase (GGDEF)-like protein